MNLTLSHVSDPAKNFGNYMRYILFLQGKLGSSFLFAFARIPCTLSKRSVDPALGAARMNGEATSAQFGLIPAVYCRELHSALADLNGFSEVSGPSISGFRESVTFAVFSASPSPDFGNARHAEKGLTSVRRTPPRFSKPCKGFLDFMASLDNNSKVMKEPPLWLLTNQIQQIQCR